MEANIANNNNSNATTSALTNSRQLLDWSLKTTNDNNNEILLGRSVHEPLELSDDVEESEYSNIEQVQLSSTKMTPNTSSLKEKEVDVVDRRVSIESFLEENLQLAYNSKNQSLDSVSSDVAEGQRLATISVIRKLIASLKTNPGSTGISNPEKTKEKDDENISLKNWQVLPLKINLFDYLHI
jgi:hypothetical protein